MQKKMIVAAKDVSDSLPSHPSTWYGLPWNPLVQLQM
jgi:hypothetical protein